MARAILPNSPLIEVVCELRFAGNLALLGVWGAIQAELRQEYPSLLVPQAQAGAAPLLQPLQLVREDRKGRVMLAINSFAVSVHKHEGFDVFRAAFRRAYDVFGRHVTLPSFTRLGLRYINVLPGEFGDAELQLGALHPCLNLSVSGFQPGARASEAPQLSYVTRRAPLDLRLALATISEPSPATKLDLDCFEAGEIARERLESFLEDAHAFIDDTFFGVITDDYHRYLEGKA